MAQPLEQKAVVDEAKIEMLSFGKSYLGMDLMEVKVAKAKGADPEEKIELFENEIKKMREGEKDPQIVVKEEELESYLKNGWQFVSVLQSQKILIRE